MFCVRKVIYFNKSQISLGRKMKRATPFIDLYLMVVIFSTKAVVSTNNADDVLLSKAEVAEYHFKLSRRLPDDFFDVADVDAQFLYTRNKRARYEKDTSCECGEGMINCLQTRYGKVCECPFNRVVVDGSCSDCVCHNGVCNGETGQCKCLRGFGLQNNTCVDCDCGEKKQFCHFVEGLTFCNCGGEYITVNQKCEDCVCGKDELCLKRPAIGICICPKGSGTWDEECDEKCDCTDSRSCMYTGLEKLCRCMPRKSKLNGECVDCDCGENAECEFVDGEKNCSCKEGYELHNGTCEECNCGEGHSCAFRNGSSICLCTENFVEHNGTCKECSCGYNERCEIIDGRKFCICKENFIRMNGLCAECWCGEGHECGSTGGKKICFCREGFDVKNGNCEECNCGTNHTCEFQNGKKVCDCLEGYVDDDGTCRECFCGENSSCFFENGEKLCICSNGQVQRNGTCSDVCLSHTCGKGTCEVNGSEFHCKCDSGYSGLHCDEEAVLSQGAIYLISVLTILTLFWIVLVLVYLIRKRFSFRYQHYRNEKLDSAANCDMTMSMLADQNPVSAM